MAKHERPSPYPAEDEETDEVTSEQVSPGFTITGKPYEFLRAMAMFWIPAFATLYFTLAQLWNLPEADAVVASLTAIDTFLGGVLGVSRNNFKAVAERTDGSFVYIPQEGGKRIYRLELTPEAEDNFHKKTRLVFDLKKSKSL